MSTLVPAGGSWLMTSPLGTVSLACVVTRPSLSPTASRAACAAAWDMPLKSGTATCATPLLTQ